MPVRSNGYFNDPNIGAAFGNLAEAFAPPSAQEVYAGAKAAETKMKMGQLAEMFALGRNGQLTPEQMNAFNQGNIVLGNQTYATSKFGVDANNATDLAKNRADNDRQLAQTGMVQKGETLRNIIAPLNVGQTRAPGLGAFFGMPRLPENTTGAMTLNQGETAILPDGRTLQGAPKPLTRTEVEGNIIAGLSPEEQRAVGLGDTPIETVPGPDGKPVIKWRADAIGAAPAAKPNEQTDITRLLAERDALPVGDPNRAAYDARIAALGRGQQQSEYDKKSDAAFAKLDEEMSANALKAYATKGTFARMKQLLADPSLDTGKFAQVRLEARKALTAMGVDAGKLADEELMSSLGNQLTLKQRDPSLGTGMPGAMSDADRNFLSAISPGLEKTPGGNMKIIDYMDRLNQRQIELESLRQEYIAKHGRTDEGFRAAIMQFSAANPLFPEAQATAGAPGAPAPVAPAAPQFRVLGVKP